jgi:branched-chain amino acid transport system permease protein
MPNVTIYIFDGIVLGMIYALVAAGYSLIFSILRIVNFAHGSIYAFGAMMTYMLIGFAVNPWIAMIVSMVMTGLLAIVLNKVGVEPLRKKNSPPIATLIGTIGVSYVISNSLILFFGSNRNKFPNFYDFGNVSMGGVEINSSKIVVILVAATLLLGLNFLIRNTHIGLSIRAVQQNTKAAKLMGINVNNVVTFTFFLAGISASIAGSLVAGYYQVVYPTMGVIMGNKTFASALLGGLGVMHGGLLGGFIIGILENIVAGTLGASMRDAVSFIILIFILIVRPAGIFGKKAINKV